MAPVLEKVWMIASLEFGPEQGKNMIVVRALCGLKSTSASFRSLMAKKLDESGFKSGKDNFDIWLRPTKKPDGEENYKNMLCYMLIMSW